jgi:NhaP-type Na+/H+ or K+/H+ antiporter
LVALFSLLVQGLTMRPLLAWLGLIADDQQRQIFQARRAQLLLLRAGRRGLRRLEEDAVI